MNIIKRRRWEIPHDQATPEAVFLDRRRFLAGAGLIAGAAVGFLPHGARAETDPSASLYPARRNEAFKPGREITPEEINSTYNNFYEFGSHKRIFQAAQALKIRPWEIRIDGLVDKEMTLGIDDLFAKVALEERLYRHRCVEAWSMAIPWTGFPLADLVRIAQPKAEATYLRMETFLDPDVASGQRQTWYPWPYTEGVTIAEATNDLAFLVTGAYGKPLAKQFGAPLRLALPWKYGFKSIKSIRRFTFTAERPTSFWQSVGPDEYGFWANVNPQVPHPRWSQASERILGTDERVPTQLFNGYAQEVAGLYKGMENEPLYR
ncbi:sulfoxide reductase catalytic subunit YedY [Breoghania corrubedonensis]|uniref:Protein-methionine-sulfoxide reductase catalytic subunit MsrP n=1 Tax=Breoghania corrubedonensis TaxID=665038 RepID=A0A2T5V5X4_9HYPH|nr:protein-methionine-sulfoxide reductase catalytic subunit MsrP [Breoghania corrubedonensis]PTW59126.1 sulfoxide reductase catalytic subunit YedY [Breoghania corrubedonensis]